MILLIPRPKTNRLFTPQNISILSTSSKFIIFLSLFIIYFNNTSYFSHFLLLSISYVFYTITGRQKSLNFIIPSFLSTWHFPLWIQSIKYATPIYKSIYKYKILSEQHPKSPKNIIQRESKPLFHMHFHLLFYLNRTNHHIPQLAPTFLTTISSIWLLASLERSFLLTNTSTFSLIIVTIEFKNPLAPKDSLLQSPSPSVLTASPTYACVKISGTLRTDLPFTLIRHYFI